MTVIRIEMEAQGQPQPVIFELEVGNLDLALKYIRERAGLPYAHVFEREGDEPICAELKGGSASVVVHACKRIRVAVRYEHDTKHHDVAPSATVFQVLLWAVGKKGFNLDDTARAKANLMLPGADQPLPRDDVIGKFVTGRDCGLTLDLTLRDFTNG